MFRKSTVMLIALSVLAAGCGSSESQPARDAFVFRAGETPISLVREDAVTTEVETRGGVVARSYSLQGVAENQRIAAASGIGDDTTVIGSALDSKLMDSARRYLDAQVMHEHSSSAKFEYFSVDDVGTQNRDITESIFREVGSDKRAVERAVTDPETGPRFVRNLLGHNWTDDGRAASTLFTFSPDDVMVADPGNPEDVATAERTGRIMAAVAESVSTDAGWNLLSNVPGASGKSAGQLNPILLQTIARSLSPYVLDLVYLNREGTAGFDGGDWADPPGLQRYAGSINVVALMNTDSDSGKLFAQAMIAEQLAAEGRYVTEIANPVSGRLLTGVGRVRGVMALGMRKAAEEAFTDIASLRGALYDRRKAAFGDIEREASENITTLPDISFIKIMLAAPIDVVMDAVIGSEPMDENWVRRFNADYYADFEGMLAAMPSLPATFRTKFPDYFDADGRLKRSADLDQKNSNKVFGDLHTMFAMSGAPDPKSSSRIRAAFDSIVYRDP